MPLFSIIVPIYNVEKYLHKCVDSILSQEFNDFELILVDDGSPDNCPQICNQYSPKDNRIKVIHKENGGLSDARNVGIKHATGEYIIFIDSDDYWQGTNNLNLLNDAILENNPDVVFYGACDANLKTGSKTISRGNYNIEKIKKSKESAVKSLIETGEFPGSAWIMMVKKTIIVNHNLNFIKGIKAEDIDWILNIFIHAKKFNAINTPFYIYIKDRQGSITQTSDQKSANDILFTINKWHRNLESNTSLVNKYLLSYLAYQYLTAFIIYAKLRKDQKQQLLPKIEKQKSILKYLQGKKGKIAFLLISSFGVSISSYFFYFFHQCNLRFPTIKKLFS